MGLRDAKRLLGSSASWAPGLCQLQHRDERARADGSAALVDRAGACVCNSVLRLGEHVAPLPTLVGRRHPQRSILSARCERPSSFARPCRKEYAVGDHITRFPCQLRARRRGSTVAISQTPPSPPSSPMPASSATDALLHSTCKLIKFPHPTRDGVAHALRQGIYSRPNRRHAHDAKSATLAVPR